VLKEKVSAVVDRGGRGRPTRTFAGVLAMVLLLATVIPPLALAERDAEGVGTAPPGALPPGLQGPEPGGEETELEEVPVGPGEEEAEEVVPPAGEEPVAPAPSPVVPSAEVPPAAAGEPGEPRVTVPATPASVPPPPEPAPPVYGPEEPTPTYEPTPAPPVEPVQGETIVEPAVAAAPAGRKGPVHHPRRERKSLPSEGAAPAVQPEPTEAPQPTIPPPVSGTPDQPASLRGSRSYTVAPGDCLWSIAESVLPAGASDEAIAGEVARLWDLNASRIGTGNPNLILVGTVLRLR
jgi:LysM domain